MKYIVYLVYLLGNIINGNSQHIIIKNGISLVYFEENHSIKDLKTDDTWTENV